MLAKAEWERQLRAKIEEREKEKMEQMANVPPPEGQVDRLEETNEATSEEAKGPTLKLGSEAPLVLLMWCLFCGVNVMILRYENNII